MKKIFLLLLLFSSFLFAEINECKNDVYFANGIDINEDDAKRSIQKIYKTFEITNPKTYNSIANWDIVYNHTHGIAIDLYESMLQKIYEDAPGDSLVPFLWNIGEIFGYLDYTFKGVVERVAKKVPKEAVKEYAAKAAKNLAKKAVVVYNKHGRHFTEEQIELMFNEVFDYLIDQAINSYVTKTEEEIMAQENADVAGHIAKYKKSIIDGHGVIIVAHSQGNLFINRAYNELGVFSDIRNDAWMKKYIRAIGVATPANNILGSNSPYLTI